MMSFDPLGPSLLLILSLKFKYFCCYYYYLMNFKPLTLVVVPNLLFNWFKP